MKKFFVFFTILFLVFTFKTAAHSGCGGYGGLGDEGFSAGLEFGIDGVNEDDRMPYLTAIASYGHSFLDNSLDVYSELNYTFGFGEGHHEHSPDEHNHHDDNAFSQSLYFNFMIGYNLRLGFDGESTLSFILQNEFDEFIISPRCEESNNITGIFTPAIRYNHELNTGDIYTQLGFPVTYIQQEKNAGTEVGLDFTLGWDSLFGLELEATLSTLLAPGDDAGFDGLELIIGYEFEPFHFSVETFFPFSDFDDRGISILPQIDYNFKNFTFYINCLFAGVGVHEHDNGHGHSLHITPALGFRYSF